MKYEQGINYDKLKAIDYSVSSLIILMLKLGALKKFNGGGLSGVRAYVEKNKRNDEE